MATFGGNGTRTKTKFTSGARNFRWFAVRWYPSDSMGEERGERRGEGYRGGAKRRGRGGRVNDVMRVLF